MASGSYIKTQKHRDNLSKSLKGKPKSEEHIKHMRENHADMSGDKNSMYGKKRGPMSDDQKLKISKSMIGKNTWMKGRTGEKSTRWDGGITPLNTAIRHSDKYKEWKIQVFGRDNFTCQCCGVRGTWLEAHHIKKFSIIKKENNIKTFEEALQCSELWNISNGITLCKKCHNETKRIK